MRRRLTMSDYNMLVDYAVENPPTHLSVANFMYGKRKPRPRMGKPSSKKKMRAGPTAPLNWTNESFEAMFSRWNGAGGSVGN